MDTNPNVIGFATILLFLGIVVFSYASPQLNIIAQNGGNIPVNYSQVNDVNGSYYANYSNSSNSSSYWDALDSPNDILSMAGFYNKTQSDGRYLFGNYTFNESDPLWTGNSSLVIYNNSPSTVNLTGIIATNITATGYLMGQPLLGMMGSGVIHANQTGNLTSVNVTCVGLTCSYSAVVLRIASVTSSAYATYCDIPAGSVTINDNATTVIYFDATCTRLTTNFTNYFETLMPAGGVWDIAQIMAHSGSAEVVRGTGLEQRRLMKQREINFYTTHLQVVQGGTVTVGTWPTFNISASKYVFLMNIQDTPKLQTAVNGIEMIAHNGTGWAFYNITGVNITHCDNGTALIPCSNANRYRRHFIFLTGVDASAELYKLAPLNSISYNTEAECLNTGSYPLTYTLPWYYDHTAVMLYAYCGKASDTSWSATGWIDMRQRPHLMHEVGT